MTLILDPIVTDSGHYFTIAEYRAWDTDFSDTAAYPDLAVERARDWAEQRFENAAGCAWVERTATETHIGDGAAFVTLYNRDIRAISAVTADGVALTADELAALIVHPSGLVKRLSGWARDVLYVFTYTYGLTAIPEPVKDAVMLLTSWNLVPNNLRSNATSESTDVGFIRLSHATPGGKTGLLEVDAVAADFGHAGAPKVG